MPKSLWTDTVSLPEFEPVQGDKKTDVLVIGGRLVWIACWWRETGLPVVRRKIPPQSLPLSMA